MEDSEGSIMGDVNQDVVQPRNLIVPVINADEFIAPAGFLCVSGAKLWVNVDGSTWELVTSA